ncbi:MAG: hypothetical protein J5486_08220 [Bacteroidaceae bacterium]|nr:hypothetical protein [Bacteroidaceae bacterium]
MTKTFRILLSAALALSFSLQSAQAQSDYIVSTEQTSETASDSTEAQAATSSLSPEEKFLNDNFPYISLCDWPSGMRFMVIPSERDATMRSFTDSLEGRQISAADLRHKVLEYRGHETTDRGWFRLLFYCPDNQRSYYYEVRNFSFEEYCLRMQGGVPALAYLGDVDKARELLIGHEFWLKSPTVYRDRRNSPRGYEQKQLRVDQHVTVVQVGVGTREYPVKIIMRTDDGELYFQTVAMSRTNSGMQEVEYGASKAHHYFANAFSIGSETDARSANMAQRLKGQKITTRRSTKMSQGGSTKTVTQGTTFTVVDVTAKPNSNYYTLRLSDRTSIIYRKDVTWVNESVSGNIDGYDEAYFPELFSMGETYTPSDGVIRRSNGSVSSTENSDYMHMIVGIISNGMTQEEVRMSKGDPSHTHRLNSGGTQWDFYDGTKVQFDRSGKVVRVINK